MPHNVPTTHRGPEPCHIGRGRAVEANARQHKVGRAVNVEVHEPAVRGIHQPLRAAAAAQRFRHRHCTGKVDLKVLVQDIVDKPSLCPVLLTKPDVEMVHHHQVDVGDVCASYMPTRSVVEVFVWARAWGPGRASTAHQQHRKRSPWKRSQSHELRSAAPTAIEPPKQSTTAE